MRTISKSNCPNKNSLFIINRKIWFKNVIVNSKSCVQKKTGKFTKSKVGHFFSRPRVTYSCAPKNGFTKFSAYRTCCNLFEACKSFEIFVFLVKIWFLALIEKLTTQKNETCLLIFTPIKAKKNWYFFSNFNFFISFPGSIFFENFTFSTKWLPLWH